MLRLGFFGLTATFLLTILGCGGEAEIVGQECVTESEYSAQIGGYSTDEIAVEMGSPSCDGDVCLVNNFQGRVTCPYGADDANVSKFVELLGMDPAAALAYARTPDPKTGALPRICLVSGADGSSVDDYVLESVAPQLESRPPSDAVYCSCRCAGPPGASDPAGGPAEYCECGEGFGCVHLVEDIGFGDIAAGSYCVRDGTMDFHRGPDCRESEGNCAGR